MPDPASVLLNDRRPTALFRAARKLVTLLRLRSFLVSVVKWFPGLAKYLLPIAHIRFRMIFPERLAVLLRVISDHGMLDRPVRVLEIGTWFGEGSTRFFAEILAQGSEIVTIDSAKPWATPQDLQQAVNRALYRAQDELAATAARHAGTSLARLARRTGCRITPLIGQARDLAQAFAPESFDIVYLDGAHYYGAVSEDLRLARRVVKQGGILAGNDFALDFPLRDDILAVSRDNLQWDSVAHANVPSGWFHPGVALALHENFPSLHVEHGLWWQLAQAGAIEETR